MRGGDNVRWHCVEKVFDILGYSQEMIFFSQGTIPDTSCKEGPKEGFGLCLGDASISPIPIKRAMKLQHSFALFSASPINDSFAKGSNLYFYERVPIKSDKRVAVIDQGRQHFPEAPLCSLGKVLC